MYEYTKIVYFYTFEKVARFAKNLDIYSIFA